MSAPKRSRRVTTSRGIHLIKKKPKDPRWQFLRIRIEALARMCSAYIAQLEVDEGGILKSFLELPNPLRQRVA